MKTINEELLDNYISSLCGDNIKENDENSFTLTKIHNNERYIFSRGGDIATIQQKYNSSMNRMEYRCRVNGCFSADEMDLFSKICALLDLDLWRNIPDIAMDCQNCGHVLSIETMWIYSDNPYKLYKIRCDHCGHEGMWCRNLDEAIESFKLYSMEE